jgi:hypothetical protein
MQLVSNWRAVLAHAWSVRALLFLMVMSGLELAVSLLGSAFIPGPAWVKALVVFSISALGTYARVVVQPKLTKAADL